MSEHRKVSLTTLGPKKDQKKEVKEERRSVRLSVRLTEPNKLGCPVFDYESLKTKQASPKKKKKEGLNGGSDPLAEEDVEKLAKHFEEKYGGERRYTYAELGAGYDESDSFIDNTDIHEEELTNEELKRYQGFYINKEKFESGSDSERPSKKKKRRRLSLPSDSESTSAAESPSKKKYKNSKKTKVKKSTSVPNGANKVISESSMSRTTTTTSGSESERSNVKS